MNEGDREMYKSIFERVYTERGREEGLAEGEAKAILKTARAMLAEAMSLDLISEITGLSIQEINSLH
jgi:predicted transposase/invertase (TIGR01784 family)